MPPDDCVGPPLGPCVSISPSSKSTEATEFAESIINTCRACNGSFEYQLEGGGSVTIMAAIPHAINYKVLSYGRGETRRIVVRCLNCETLGHIPMTSATKFYCLMELVGSGNTVWLDAMSVDQDNHEDVASQMKVMGQIYSNAQSVSVLLPLSDGEAYVLLGTLTDAAETLLGCVAHFKLNYEDEIAFLKESEGRERT